jgi:2-succinyl-5-enolpyruvyl-6-hydroxy-3-cyclohexene-1-carboxylate synthase
LDITAIVKAFGIEAKKVNNREEYLQHLQQWNKNPKFMILECLFNDEDNIRTYDQLKTVKL